MLLVTAFSVLEQGAAGLWLEVSPPRGVDAEPLLSHLAAVRGKVQAVNLTDNALGRVKMSPLVFGGMVRARLGLGVVVNVSCRDRNRLALQSDLLGAGALGLDGIVALGGDRLPPESGVTGVRDLNVLSLLRMVGRLNRGDTGEGKPALKTLPALVAGVVANPNRVPLEPELDLLRRKAEAGAQFVLTQPVFDAEVGRRFAAAARSLGLKVVLGILPIKHETMASYIKKQVQDLAEAGRHFDRFSGLDENRARELSIRLGLDLMAALAPEVACFTIMSGGGPSLAIELVIERYRQQAAQRT